ncbi:MAG: hypothetical protein CMH83_04310 [Nocardioides sp.]|nr:hypothetical protein [Nocardioides sp.]
MRPESAEPGLVEPAGDPVDARLARVAARREDARTALAEVVDATLARCHRAALLLSGGDTERAESVVRAAYRRVWDHAADFAPGRFSGSTWVLSQVRLAAG